MLNAEVMGGGSRAWRVREVRLAASSVRSFSKSVVMAWRMRGGGRQVEREVCEWGEVDGCGGWLVEVLEGFWGGEGEAVDGFFDASEDEEVAPPPPPPPPRSGRGGGSGRGSGWREGEWTGVG